MTPSPSDTMSDATPDTVILFDIMSTVVYDPFYEHMPDFFDMGFDELLEAKDPDAWFEFERGEIDESTLAERFFDARDPIDLEGLKQHFYEHYRFIDGMEALLTDLSDRGFELHAFSNYGPWYRMIEDKLEVSRFLDWSFVSCDTGVRKPDAESYTHVVETLGVEPGDCLFVDDREVNIEGARDEGMSAFVFEDTETTRRQLDEHLSLESPLDEVVSR